MNVPKLFSTVVDGYLATHDKPLPELYPTCWEFGGDGWAFAMNGHGETRLGGPHDGMRCEVPPYSLGVWRNGWLAGFVDSSGGVLAGGLDEHELIEAAKKCSRQFQRPSSTPNESERMNPNQLES